MSNEQGIGTSIVAHVESDMLSSPYLESKSATFLNRSERGVGQMSTGLTLLLTHDPLVKDALSSALLHEGGISCLAETSEEAMKIVCRQGSELELAVIDFDLGSNGMTLMSAIDACSDHQIPMVAVTGLGENYARLVALAEGAAECMAKPVSAEQLRRVITKYRPRWDLAHKGVAENFDE